MKFAREAWPFVLPFWLLAVLLALLGRPGWALAALIVGCLVLLFFRDPRTPAVEDPALVLSAATGKVTLIDVVDDAAVGPGRFHRVVTFLSVFDVHVQRTPVAGEVAAARFTSGRKVAAFRADAGAVNENHLTVLRRPNGDLVGVRQIAGLIARRVVCYLQPGTRVERAQPLGLIKFGSRVDLLVPESYQVLVARGDRVAVSVTAIAREPDASRGKG